jgi:hypothetical protein
MSPNVFLADHLMKIASTVTSLARASALARDAVNKKASRTFAGISAAQIRAHAAG